MAKQYRLGQTGILYRVKLRNCSTGDPYDVSEIVDQKIVFYKNNGDVFDKDADLTEDDDNPGEFFIQYFNTFPEESILDLRGDWEFAAVAQLITGDFFENPTTELIWVV